MKHLEQLWNLGTVEDLNKIIKFMGTVYKITEKALNQRQSNIKDRESSYLNMVGLSGKEGLGEGIRLFFEPEKVAEEKRKIYSLSARMRDINNWGNVVVKLRDEKAEKEETDRIARQEAFGSETRTENDEMVEIKAADYAREYVEFNRDVLGTDLSGEAWNRMYAEALARGRKRFKEEIEQGATPRDGHTTAGIAAQCKSEGIADTKATQAEEGAIDEYTRAQNVEQNKNGANRQK